jgi:hypothetical protein
MYSGGWNRPRNRFTKTSPAKRNTAVASAMAALVERAITDETVSNSARRRY